MTFKFIFQKLRNEKNATFIFQKNNFLNYTFHTRIVHGFSNSNFSIKLVIENWKK